MLTKPELRKALRRLRKALKGPDHAARSARAARFITRLAQFSHGRRVAVTLPFDGECDTAPLVRAARERGVRLYTPVIADRRHRRLRFVPLGGPMRRGTYGILVPHNTGPALPPRWFDLIVVPLVGIDRDGRRLGMGGGYYDRAFAFRARRTHWRGPRLVAFAFDCQRVDSVHAEPWDLRVDDLASESGLHHFAGS